MKAAFHVDCILLGSNLFDINAFLFYLFYFQKFKSRGMHSLTTLHILDMVELVYYAFNFYLESYFKAKLLKRERERDLFSRVVSS